MYSKLGFTKNAEIIASKIEITKTKEYAKSVKCLSNNDVKIGFE